MTLKVKGQSQTSPKSIISKRGTITHIAITLHQFLIVDTFSIIYFFARDAFARTNRRAIVMLFVRLYVCLSVCLGRGCIVITVHSSADLSLWLDSPMFWAL